MLLLLLLQLWRHKLLLHQKAPSHAHSSNWLRLVNHTSNAALHAIRRLLLLLLVLLLVLRLWLLLHEGAWHLTSEVCLLLHNWLLHDRLRHRLLHDTAAVRGTVTAKHLLLLL